MSRMLGMLLVVVVTGPFAAAQDSPSAPAAEKAEHRVKRMAQAIAADVAKFRGLDWKAPVAIGVYTVPELEVFVERRLEQDFPPGRRAAIERIGRLLGYWPEDYDLGSGLKALLREQIGGFYDPDAKELRLVDRGGSGDGAPTDRIVLWHELVHALQDQHFELRRLPLDCEDDADLAAASAALVEGDATLAMLGAGFGKLPAPDSAAAVFEQGKSVVAALRLMGGAPSLLSGGGAELKKAPRVLREGLVFPYLAGLEFCLARGGGGIGFAGVDRALAAPPLSTEQVLHPERFEGEGRDLPEVYELADVARFLGEGAALVATDTLGEQGLRVLFGAVGPRRAAERAAAGWDGDRHALYARPGRNDTLVLQCLFDSEDDADEAVSAFVAWAQHSGGGRKRVELDWSPWCSRGPDGEVEALVRRGREIAFVRNVPEPDAGSLLTALLDRSRRRERGSIPERTPR